MESSGKKAELSLTVILIITFCLNFILAGSYRYMLLLIRCLQIMLHIPLMRILIPSNVSMMNSILVPIAMFDIMDNNNIL